VGRFERRSGELITDVASVVKESLGRSRYLEGDHDCPFMNGLLEKKEKGDEQVILRSNLVKGNENGGELNEGGGRGGFRGGPALFLGTHARLEKKDRNLLGM